MPSLWCRVAEERDAIKLEIRASSIRHHTTSLAHLDGRSAPGYPGLDREQF